MKHPPLASGAVRLLLASAVVVSHYSSLPIGRAAVYLFFTLSGYWVLQMWQDLYSRTKAPYFTFMVSRYWRLLPILLSAIAFRVLISRWLLPAQNQSGWPEVIRAIVILGVSWAPMFTMVEWSLDVEVQFYLVVPLLYLLLKPMIKPTRPILVAFLLSVLATVGFGWMKGDHVQNAHLAEYFLFFAFGMMAFFWPWLHPGPRWTWALAFAAIVGFMLLRLNPSTADIVSTLHPAIGLLAPLHEMAELCWALAFVPAVLASVRRPSSKFDRHFGNLAYCVYLFHLPIQLIYSSFRKDFLSLPAQLVWLAASLLLCAGVSILVYFVVDRPAERLRHRWVHSRLLPA